MPPNTLPERLTEADAAWTSKRCSRCGGAFRCGADTPSCWCDRVTLSTEQRARLAELRLDGCLCPDCLRAL